jgi:hypothetical protein
MRRALIASLDVRLYSAVRRVSCATSPLGCSRLLSPAATFVTMAESKSKHGEHWVAPGNASEQYFPTLKVYNSLTKSKVARPAALSIRIDLRFELT